MLRILVVRHERAHKQKQVASQNNDLSGPSGASVTNYWKTWRSYLNAFLHLSVLSQSARISPNYSEIANKILFLQL